ncbi:MAG: hypothetical protein QOJ82_3995 [Solirubrobacteraceae bacterium]|nr:hypothetical protein [Solirubrobacteraceae bacterium]
MGSATHVTVCDVGPRDGLQNARMVLSPELRAELCVALIRVAGELARQMDREPPGLVYRAGRA